MPPSHQSPIPFESERIGAAAVACSDGRFGEHVDEFLHQGLGLPRYDRIALPGGPALLAGHIAVWRDEEALAAQLRFLIAAHELERVVLIAHQDCGFYRRRLGLVPIELEPQQRGDLEQAARRLQAFGALRVDAFFARQVGRRVCFEPVVALAERVRATGCCRPAGGTIESAMAGAAPALPEPS